MQKRNTIDPLDFRFARSDAHLSINAAASFLAVTPKTIKNWESGKSPIPVAAFLVMSAKAQPYALPHKDWARWTLCEDGKLYSPANIGFLPTEIEYIPMQYQLIALFQAEVRRLLTKPVPCRSKRHPRRRFQVVG
jgi:transcriptional regulator with XRE-family HTH domain